MKIKNLWIEYGFIYGMVITIMFTFIYFYTLLSGYDSVSLTFNDYHEKYFEMPAFGIGILFYIIHATIHIRKEWKKNPKSKMSTT